MRRKPNPTKAKKHEKKGDEFFLKGKFDKALKEYRTAAEAGPDLPEIYNKLVKTKDMMGGDWKMEDFAESVSWVMKGQEKEHPPIKQIHAKLSPEWKNAQFLAMGIIAGADKKRTGEMIEELARMGEIATRALIDLIIELKNAAAR